MNMDECSCAELFDKFKDHLEEFIRPQKQSEHKIVILPILDQSAKGKADNFSFFRCSISIRFMTKIMDHLGYVYAIPKLRNNTCLEETGIEFSSPLPAIHDAEFTSVIESTSSNDRALDESCCYSKPFYCAGGRVWVWPSIQQIQKISLTTMTLVVESPRVYTKKGVPVSVTGIAQVKISGQNKEMLAHACQLFLGKTEREIAQISLETMEGHQRAIMGLMTVEEIYQDRQKFAEKVFEVASSDLLNMGIAVVSYVLKDVRDEEHYLQSLGMSRTAEVKRDARIGEAEANKDAKIREALADEKRLAARYNNDVGIAKAKRDYELCQAEYDQQVQAQKAVADLAYSLQAAKIKQKIKEEEMQVKVVERTQSILLQEQEIQRKQKELDATIKRPAEAEKFMAETLAEAERQKIILAAQADAEAIKMKGDAEAFAIEAKAKAEAEQMAKKAEAWKEYKNAAMVDMLLDVLPKVAAEVAAPFTEGVKQITMVSTGKGEMGAAKLTGEIMDIVARVPDMVSKMTGVDLTQVTKPRGF